MSIDDLFVIIVGVIIGFAFICFICDANRRVDEDEDDYYDYTSDEDWFSEFEKDAHAKRMAEIIVESHADELHEMFAPLREKLSELSDRLDVLEDKNHVIR